MTDLKDRTVFITGASAGIGAACAEVFAEHGARLLLCARRTDRLAALADRLRRDHGVAVHPFALDVRDADAVRESIDGLPETWQAIDVLVNNAGLAKSRDKFQDLNYEHIDAMVDTNVKGLLYVTRAVLPGMVARDRGHVINLGSIAGRQVYPGATVYCATKFAVHAVTMGLKIDLLGTGVRVSSVDPGLVETEFSLVRFEGDAERAAAVYAGLTPLTPRDVAEAVVFCATRPPHVDVTEMVVLASDQATATMTYRRS